MANTFKVKTHTAMPDTAGTPLTLYTCPGSTTTIVLGLVVANLDGSTRTASVQLVSDTSDTETNATVFGVSSNAECITATLSINVSA